ALQSLAQRNLMSSQHYKDLQGFLTLGLTQKVLESSTKPPQAPREEQHHPRSSPVVWQELWRSSSSLQHHAEESLVSALMNGCLVSSGPRPFTPHNNRVSSSQRLHLSGSPSRCSAIASNRPLSRAAQEIQEIQTVQLTDLQNELEEEKTEEYLALARLEEEFKNISITPLPQ
ncbi:hypothetical protein DNTS_009893, partial [Danionella cerebrum]